MNEHLPHKIPASLAVNIWVLFPGQTISIVSRAVVDRSCCHGRDRSACRATDDGLDDRDMISARDLDSSLRSLRSGGFWGPSNLLSN